MNNYAVEFVSGGPKNYSYLMNNNRSVCKVKGVTMNYENSDILNFYTVKDFILSNVLEQSEMFGNIFLERQIKTKHMQFVKDISTKSVITKYITKNYNMSYDKCKIIIANDHIIDTVPFGFDV